MCNFLVNTIFIVFLNPFIIGLWTIRVWCCIRQGKDQPLCALSVLKPVSLPGVLISMVTAGR